MSSGRSDERFVAALAIVLALGTLLRILYLHAQVTTDPWFGVPQLDGASYLAWARAIVDGHGGPTGAYYLAPLYPWTLALLFRVGADSPSTLYAAQQLLSVLTAGGLAIAVRPIAGAAAAVASAALYLGSAPILFFAARPLGETLAIALLTAALAVLLRTRGAPGGWVAGALVGAATLARPNLLLVAAAWIAVDAARRRPRRAIGIACGLMIVIFPVTARNAVVSGHPVLVSSNAGMTLYHGNGRGAERTPDDRPCGPEPCGIYRQPDGLRRGLETIEQQRDTATEVARELSGRPLDAVEADAWWGRRAVRDRLAHPADTALLFVRRAALLLDSHEFGLDYPPLLDPNPWRPTVRLGAWGELGLVPWVGLLGLAAAAVAARGVRGSGGIYTWSAIAACAVAPLVFYVSSRYRLPVTALLVLPAGTGAAAVLRSGPRRMPAIAAALVVVALAVSAAPLLTPRRRLVLEESAGALMNRSVAWRRAGRAGEAEADAREALRRLPESAWLHYNLGVVLTEAKRFDEAEAEYRTSLRLDPAQSDASANLGALLFGQGRLDEAVEVLRTAVFLPGANAACWTNLIVALVAQGNRAAARDAIEEARERGVEIPDPLARLVQAGGTGSLPEEP